MKFGLSQESLELIQKTLSEFKEIDSAIIYGSRAMGNFREGSDIDISLKGKGLNLKIQTTLMNDLDDLLLPYTFDISIYHQISNEDLKDHIDRVGIPIYKNREK